jgi:tripartite-type tricarboxylate transporter receptor subunit TctC
MIARLILWATSLAALLAAGAPTQAQSYPSRPIKLVVAVLPGGPMDVMGRLMAQHLSATFGQLFVENRAGPAPRWAPRRWQAPSPTATRCCWAMRQLLDQPDGARRTPKEIVGKLNAAINAGVASPAMQARFKQLAAEARPGTPEDLAAFIAGEIPKWHGMAKLAGITGE